MNIRTNHLRALSFIIIFITMFINCTSFKHIDGNYIETKYRDTLIIHKDNTYEYNEKLYSGYLGWTKGTWKIIKRKIQFVCDHKPLVNIHMKLRRDTLSNEPQIKFLLADTQEPILIENAKVYTGNVVLKNDSFKITNNTIKIFTKDFDSIQISTQNYVDIIIPNILKANHGYLARIYPAERLYELDKTKFIKRKTTLFQLGTPNKQEQIFLTFKKNL